MIVFVLCFAEQQDDNLMVLNGKMNKINGPDSS